MFIHNEIRKNLSLFSDICKNHGIKSLYAFGSSVTEQFNPQRSDIDLLVEMEDMDPLEKGEKLLSLWDKLEDFFQRKVDLLRFGEGSPTFSGSRISNTSFGL